MDEKFRNEVVKQLVLNQFKQVNGTNNLERYSCWSKKLEGGTVLVFEFYNDADYKEVYVETNGHIDMFNKIKTFPEYWAIESLYEAQKVKTLDKFGE